MSDIGEANGGTPVGEVVPSAEEGGIDVGSSDEDYDPGVFTQPDPVQQFALVPVRQALAFEPIQPQHGADPVQNDETVVVQRFVIFWLANANLWYFNTF